MADSWARISGDIPEGNPIYVVREDPKNPNLLYAGSEFDTLRGILNDQRSLMVWKLDGLDLEQAGRSMVPSGTSLLGMVKHLAWVERWWFVEFIGGGKPDYPWSDEDPDADWRIEPGFSLSPARSVVDAAARHD